jgi:hypothetical protein
VVWATVMSLTESPQGEVLGLRCGAAVSVLSQLRTFVRVHHPSRGRFVSVNRLLRSCHVHRLAKLESGLGASPRGFESRILRHCHKGKRSGRSFLASLDPARGLS